MLRKQILLAPPPQPSPPLPDGGRAMGEGTGVRFRAGGSSEDPPLLPRERQNLLDHPRHILEHPVVGEPHHRKSRSPNKGIALPVPLRLFRMDLAVQLDDQPDLPATEIRDERSDRELAPEFQVPQPPIAQDRPHRPLRGRLPFSQTPSHQIAHPSSPDDLSS